MSAGTRLRSSYTLRQGQKNRSHITCNYHINKTINYNRCYTHLAVKQTEAQGNDLFKIMSVTGRT